MRPTDHELAVATDALARHYYAEVRENLDIGLAWDDLDLGVRFDFRERAFDAVRVVLEALPDRAEEVVRRVQEHCCTCHLADPPHEDWCPASAIEDELSP